MNQNYQQMQTKIINMINQNKENAIFSGAVDEKIIQKGEKLLDVILPDQYSWFIKSYGYGGIGGVEIYGVPLTKEPQFAEVTLYYRKNGLPKQYVVIQNCDEWLDCIDTANGKVVTWSAYDEDGVIVAYDSFYEYLIDSFQEAIDNL